MFVILLFYSEDIFWFSSRGCFLLTLRGFFHIKILGVILILFYIFLYSLVASISAHFASHRGGRLILNFRRV
ncbi:hypothetical protein Lalb_Chr02g0155201 [Lupinus albus]|uniref:Uncharacterized protein n=1 Tax=Lupinus albus TaxID=3870 RepID=A0A6A4R1Y9_LUPAL|nr:hypothetical protein Lalb_Chr02g0155201 [Lupinus albus]